MGLSGGEGGKSVVLSVELGKLAFLGSWIDTSQRKGLLHQSWKVWNKLKSPCPLSCEATQRYLGGTEGKKLGPVLQRSVCLKKALEALSSGQACSGAVSNGGHCGYLS